MTKLPRNLRSFCACIAMMLGVTLVLVQTELAQAQFRAESRETVRNL
jgi:hypothetical protein